MRDLQKQYEFIRELSIKAGELILDYAEKGFTIEAKTNGMNLVTAADKACEKFIVEHLRENFAEDGIIAEEGSESVSSSGYHWLIDPIDGTTNYAHGYPLYCISIALIDEKKQPVLGVVYNPFFKEMFSAIIGMGSYLNGMKLSVSEVPSLSKALISTGFPYNRIEVMKKILSRLEQFLYIVNDVRRTGSAAIDICYVACGRNDMYYEEGLNAWDTAAALLIATEAGAKASKFDGSLVDVFFPEIVVSNGNIHSESLEIIQATEHVK